MPRKLTTAEVDDLVRRYQAGETQQQIATALGIHQGSVSKWIIKRGAQRSASEVMRARMATLTPQQRSAQAAAAHEAVRGMTRTESDLIARAHTKMLRQSHATDEERAIAARLIAAGEQPVLQEAIGQYNLDIGVAPVAVELFGGGWHAHGRHRARLPQRVVDLADAGRNLLVIWTHETHPLDIAVVAQETLAYLETSRRNPSFRRQYRVLWGDGQFLAAGCVDDDELTLVPTGIRGTYRRRAG